jgi:predicted alpha/beta-fold hydrolase
VADAESDLERTRLAVDASARAQGSGHFSPASWLVNPHVQSIFPSLPFRRPGVERSCSGLLQASRPEIVDCGDGVRLLALRATQERAGRAPASRLVVLLHGWEGSADSLYILSLGQHLFDRGFEVVRLNLRDHGDSHHLNAEIFHSCRIAEVVGAARSLQRSSPAQGLNLVGFSLGGNFFLRVGARAAAAGLDLERVVAVCPVLDPEHTLLQLERGWALYRQYFIWKWRRSLRRKQAAWPQLYDLGPFLQLDSLTAMTEHLVRTYGGYPSLPEYLRGYAVVGDVLASVVHPTRIIAAADDPIIPSADLVRLARPPALEVTCTELGGHCGYYEGGSGSTWIEREVSATLGRA